MSESQRIIQAAQASETITDAEGRAITVRRRSRKEVMRLMRGWGPACNVEYWLGQAMIAASATAIDGRPLPDPVTPERAELIADQLGDEGMAAIGAWYEKQGIGAEPEEVKEAAKN